MKGQLSLPTRKETIIVLAVSAIFMLLTGIFVGLRTEHFLIVLLFLLLFFSTIWSRKLAVALIPFAIFGISYDWMRIYPNYMVNPIDIQGLYELEKSWFGIVENGIRMIPCEYFAIHHHVIADLFAGIFYLTWVPVPIAFGLWLYIKKERKLYLHFSIVFLLVNLIGFAGYYIHPAAPPWYVMNNGFDVVLETMGNTAGLGRFDQLTGLSVFDSLYSRNSNVFAAIPSLHSAYMVVALWYAVVRKSHWALTTILAVLMVGIWCTAVYSGHHYIIDVLLGIFCALLGILVFEKGLMQIKGFSNFIDRYWNYIKD